MAEAVSKIGISRSAFYKYKDSVAPFLDMKRGQIITFHLILRNKKGLLSSVLWAFADSGANILTINQSIPINGTASVTISAESEGLKISTEELLLNLRSIDGLLKTEVIAG